MKFRSGRRVGSVAHLVACPVTRPATQLGRVLAAIALALVWVASPAHAQLLARTTVIQNVTVHLPDGETLENASVAIRGTRIIGVGTEVSVPRNAVRIDGSGMHVTPGLIDVGSVLAFGGNASGGNRVDASAIDGFDRYERRFIDEAIANGVTTIALVPGGQRGFGPAVSVIRLRSGSGTGAGGGTVGETLEPRLALTLNMRSGDGPMARLSTVDSVRARLREAVEREKALEAYETALEEFMKKAEEKRKEKEKDTPAATPAPAPARPQPRPEAGDGPRPTPGGEPPRRRPRGGMADDEPPRDDDSDDDSDAADDAELQQRPPRRGGPPPAAAPAQAPRQAPPPPASGRPQRPAPNRQLDIVIAALHQEVPVRVLADRAEDILNALEIAEEFNLSIVIDGGAEAHLVASELAAAGASVILSTPPISDMPRRGTQLRSSRDTAAILERHGVEWAFGSGGASRDVLFAAHLLVQQSGVTVSPLELVTRRAARALGIDDRLGAVAEGMQADLVLFSGDPADPASRVQRVIVAGETVHERKDGDS